MKLATVSKITFLLEAFTYNVPHQGSDLRKGVVEMFIHQMVTCMFSELLVHWTDYCKCLCSNVSCGMTLYVTNIVCMHCVCTAPRVLMNRPSCHYRTLSQILHVWLHVLSTNLHTALFWSHYRTQLHIQILWIQLVEFYFTGNHLYVVNT